MTKFKSVLKAFVLTSAFLILGKEKIHRETSLVNREDWGKDELFYGISLLASQHRGLDRECDYMM